MTPMDMHSCQASLGAIERLCTPKKAHAQSGEKAFHKNKAGAKWPSTGATKQVPKKVCFERSCKLCKNYGVRILRTLLKFATGTRKIEQ
jgi:hypothetical protein